MRIKISIGWKHPDLMGVRKLGVVIREEYGESVQTNVRIDHMSHAIAESIRQGMGKLLCEELDYVGYTIVWTTKTVERGGSGTASITYKEKSNCPVEMLKYGRHLLRMLNTSYDNIGEAHGEAA